MKVKKMRLVIKWRDLWFLLLRRQIGKTEENPQYAIRLINTSSEIFKLLLPATREEVELAIRENSIPKFWHHWGKLKYTISPNPVEGAAVAVKTISFDGLHWKFSDDPVEAVDPRVLENYLTLIEEDDES